MSTHPNTILMVTLTPDDLARKTMRSILEANGADDDSIKIGEKTYITLIMEGDYEDDLQISGQEGDLIFFDYITYGYGQREEWAIVEGQKNELEAWARDMCERFNCLYKIELTANYW